MSSSSGINISIQIKPRDNFNTKTYLKHTHTHLVTSQKEGGGEGLNYIINIFNIILLVSRECQSFFKRSRICPGQTTRREGHQRSYVSRTSYFVQ